MGIELVSDKDPLGTGGNSNGVLYVGGKIGLVPRLFQPVCDDLPGDNVKTWYQA